MPSKITSVKKSSLKVSPVSVRVRKKYVKTDSETTKVKAVTAHKVNLVSSIRHVLFKNYPKFMTLKEVIEELEKDGVDVSPKRASSALAFLSGITPTHMVKTSKGAYVPAFRNDITAKEKKIAGAHHLQRYVYRFNPKGVQKGRPCRLDINTNKIKSAFFVK